MASREGQGMQIAVILFAMLTVVLAITTYVFYAESSKVSDQLKAAQDQFANADKGQKSANYKVAALKRTLGMATQTDVDAAKSQAGGTADTEVDKLLADFVGDMALVGDDEKNPKEDYRKLVNRLLLTINQKNNSQTIATTETATVQQQKDKEVADALAAKELAETTLAEEQKKYAVAQQTLQDQVDQTKKEKEDLNNQFAAAIKVEKDRGDKLQVSLDQLIKDYGLAQNQIAALRTERDQLAQDQGANIENPDGQVVWINQRQRMVWINLGSADNLTRQMTFSVFSQEQASAFKVQDRPKLDGTGDERVALLQAKGRIEVVRITGPKQAECRILEDSPADPILPGDWIQTPAWSPGQQTHYAVVGFIDIDDDGQSDRELLHNLITVNGGVIDAELKEDGTIGGAITVKTRHYIVGKHFGEKGTAAAFKDEKAYQDGLNKMEKDRLANGVQSISLEQFLERMGWKPEEKTIGLGGSSDVGPTFRRRSPPAGAEGGAAPPAATPMPMPTTPMPETPATPAGTDPFETKP